MAAILEREIKLGFRDPEEARRAILATGATPLRGRRLQEDCLLDTPDDQLHQRRCVLRVRMPQGADVRVIRDGAAVHEARVAALDLDVGEPGRYRVEARIDGRLWLLSNPVYLR